MIKKEASSKNRVLKDIDKITDDDYDFILDTLIEKARNDFYTFVRLLAPEILPEEFIDGKHIEIICNEFMEIEDSVANPEKKPGRLQLFLPPGSMKSKIASNLFPAWCLGRHPNWCFLAIGSDFEFAVDNFGRPTKDIIDLDQYKAIFPNTILRKDVQGAGRWDTVQKGRFVARGAGQNIAGRRAHISICDDVITEQTTDNDRKKINKWYLKGLRTRLLPNGAEIIINTRWHLEDLSGYTTKIDGVLGKERDKDKRPWKIVSIPALVDKEASLLLKAGNKDEKRFDVGTSFWPELWSTESFLEKKETFPPHDWNALYMQSPTAEEGNIVKRQHFKIWDEDAPPTCKYVLVSMDTAFSTSETADYSAYSVWGVFENIYKDFDGNDIKQNCMILLASGNGRWEFSELCNKAQELNNQYRPDFFIIEKKASGQSLIQEMRKRSLPIVDYMPERDKVFRLHACTPYFQSGRIWIPKNRQWAQELVEEVISFPNAPHDDLVDTVSQAVLWLKDTYNIDNDGIPYDPDYEEDRYWAKKNRKTYWSSAIGA